MIRALLVALLLAGCEAPVAPAVHVDAGPPADAWPHPDDLAACDRGTLLPCPSGRVAVCSRPGFYDVGCDARGSATCAFGGAPVVCVRLADAGL